MRELRADVAVIGGGPAGLAAGVAALRMGADTVIIERNPELGGVLLQCIHPGFGLKLYGEELTGPEYACRWLDQLGRLRDLTDTTVLGVEADHTILASSAKLGLFTLRARAVVLAMGCRERTRGAIGIPGRRPAGVMTSGTAQYLVNLHGYMPGRRFAVLGSGDIGMIMARRLTWEGAEVVGVYELMPYLSGLRRNYVQCLLDYNIPLHLSHTVTEIHGSRRVSGVSVAPVGADRQPLLDRESLVAADTLLLSVGLIPENELTRGLGAEIDPSTGGPYVDNRMETSLPGVFAAGNVVHVYDLVDDVSLAGEVAGANAARHAMTPPALTGRALAALTGRAPAAPVGRALAAPTGRVTALPGRVRVLAGENVRAVVPQWLRRDDAGEGFELHLRARAPVEVPCLLTLASDGAGGKERVVARTRLKYVRPGEMISLPVPARAAGLLGDVARLDLRPVEGE